MHRGNAFDVCFRFAYRLEFKKIAYANVLKDCGFFLYSNLRVIEFKVNLYQFMWNLWIVSGLYIYRDEGSSINRRELTVSKLSTALSEQSSPPQQLVPWVQTRVYCVSRNLTHELSPLTLLHCS